MRRYIFCILLVLARTILLAQFPSFDSYTISDISTVSFTYNGFAHLGKNNAEVPPWIIPGGWISYFFVDGSDTYIWSSPASLTEGSSLELNDAFGPHTVAVSYIHSPDYAPNKNTRDWKRNYHGIYSAVYFKHPDAGAVSLGFLHGENKNFVAGDAHDPLAQHYQNSIQQNVTINPSDPASYSGGFPYHEGWKAYNGIISAAWIPNTKKTQWGQQFFENELGPIAWPSTGYINSRGSKCTIGLRHPSSLMYNDSIYVFYVEEGPAGNYIPDEEGRHKGIKVIRASLRDALDPHGYRVYYRQPDGHEIWSPSLPAGFTKENMLQFTGIRGPKATDIMDDQKGVSQEIRFSAARVRNSDYFIGVEQYIDRTDSAKFKVALRLSSDLIHWTDRVRIVYTARNWDHSRMNYPIFLSKDGWSNTEVDIDDFYILGTGQGPANFVNKIHLQAAPAFSAYALTGAIPASSLGADLAYPNPNKGLFRLSYTLTASSYTDIQILDMCGRRLRSLRKGRLFSGRYTEDLDISEWPDGFYLVGLFQDKNTRWFKVLKR